jgi:hypothetical protein
MLFLHCMWRGWQVGWRSGQAKPCLLSKKKKVACVPAVVAVAGCLFTVLMHACMQA